MTPTLHLGLQDASAPADASQDLMSTMRQRFANVFKPAAAAAETLVAHLSSPEPAKAAAPVRNATTWAAVAAADPAVAVCAGEATKGHEAGAIDSCTAEQAATKAAAATDSPAAAAPSVGVPPTPADVDSKPYRYNAVISSQLTAITFAATTTEASVAAPVAASDGAQAAADAADSADGAIPAADTAASVEEAAAADSVDVSDGQQNNTVTPFAMFPVKEAAPAADKAAFVGNDAAADPVDGQQNNTVAPFAMFPVKEAAPAVKEAAAVPDAPFQIAADAFAFNFGLAERPAPVANGRKKKFSAKRRGASGGGAAAAGTAPAAPWASSMGSFSAWGAAPPAVDLLQENVLDAGGKAGALLAGAPLTGGAGAPLSALDGNQQT